MFKWDTYPGVYPAKLMLKRTYTAARLRKVVKSAHIVFIISLLLGLVSAFAIAETDSIKPITLRAWGVPGNYVLVIRAQADFNVLKAFRERYPNIRPVSSQGLEIPGGSRTTDFVPFMQIAGDIAPDVLYVSFRHSQTYIQNKLLYPLDRYVEDMLGVEIKNGPAMSLDEYLAELKKSPKYGLEIENRFPEQCWKVIRRECPSGDSCPYCRKWGIDATKRHYHIWCFPQASNVSILYYHRDFFQEAGLNPDMPPDTLEKLLEYARKLTVPEEDRYGLWLGLGEELANNTLGFLHSMGGRLVTQNDNGDWQCVFDSEAAVETYYFVARLYHEPFINSKGKRVYGVIYPGDRTGLLRNVAIWNGEIRQEYFSEFDPAVMGLAPIPVGPSGERRCVLDADMTGIYAGLDDDKDTRDAAWKWIHFFRGPIGRATWAKVYVERGFARFLQPDLLKEAGYAEYVNEVNPNWAEAYREAMKNSVPQPYGKNCQMVFSYVGKAIDQIRTDPDIRQAIEAGDAQKAKGLIRRILKERVRSTNEKMLNLLSPKQRKFRAVVASIVAVVILTIFVFVLRSVFRAFAATVIRDVNAPKGSWQFGRYKWAYILMIPAVGSVALWMYYPLIRGSIIAFENYNVRGFSEFVGMENFANVLFDDEFWHSMWISLKYAIGFMFFGFTAPIALAFLLTEVPRGKVFFRIIYYLPAVLSGVVVIFLWKSFYGSSGMINEVINLFINLVSLIPGVEIAHIHKRWLEDPSFALLCVLMPVIWAGMGPGCLIYLAALKTIPEETYEAADVDGAGIWQKVFHVAIPSIKGLIMINFIGVMVATIQGGSQFALAMTGGGPYTPYGQTEFVGLHIYWQAFGFLKFGTAAAMAWVLGAMLVGFTVMQMKRLSRMEFKTGAGVA